MIESRSISLHILGRAPQEGAVKTRLIPALGARGATLAHEQLLAHVVSVARRWCQQKTGRYLHLWCTPGPDHPYFDSLLPDQPRYCQPEGNLGEKMAAISQFGLKKSQAVILLGGDCVSVTPALLDQVETALEAVPAVMAPAEDGGYVLLGLTRMAVQLFDSIPWGSDRVAQLTRLRLMEMEWSWREFPNQWDVDRPKDWDRFSSEIAVNDRVKPVS